MNAWDIDPNLYGPLWREIRRWLAARRKARQAASARCDAGCRT